MPANRILIVDDNKGQRLTLESILKRSGYSVSSADCGTAALSIAEKENFAAALLDIKMPDITGIEVLKQLKQMHPNTIVIMMTGFAESEYAIEALNHGAAAYILKPANIEQIKTLLNQALEHHRLVEENQAMSMAMKEWNQTLEKKVLERTQELEGANRVISDFYGELKKNFESTLEILAIAIDLRDNLTHSHSFRVTEYALEIGKVLDIPESDRQKLRYAALLHDLGKIQVKKEILSKDGSLTAREYREIQDHAQGTFDLLSKFKFQADYAEIPLIAASHHEKFDGSGYPQGLKGEEIPFLSRILGVADVLDAITSRRHYRTAMSIESALGILKRERGGHFDPRCADAAFKMNLADFTKIHLAEFLGQCDITRVNLLSKYTVGDLYDACSTETPSPDRLEMVRVFHEFYQGPVPKAFEGKISPARRLDQAA